LPRHADPDLEPRILAAASRLWARGGEKAFTMRAVARAAGTTTPTVYERYRDRDDILRALRLKTRQELFAALSRARTLRDAVRRMLDFALQYPHAYEVLFDGVGQPPSLHEPWPTFNLIRDRIAQRLGGSSQQYNRLMLSIWSLMHGAAMLIIRGGFEGPLRRQTLQACIEAVETMVQAASESQGVGHSGPKWPGNLVLGEGTKSRVGSADRKKKQSQIKTSKSAAAGD